MLQVVNPTTEEVIGEVAEGTPEDVDAAVTRAAAAFPAWAATPVDERAKLARRVAEELAARADEFAATMTAEMGTPTMFATRVQVPNPVGIARGVAAALEAGYFAGEEIGNSLVLREPVGVVGAITPWNFPLQQMVAKVVPALAAGDVVVLKPSELAPGTADLLAEVLRSLDLPEGVFQVVHGLGPVVGEALAAHPAVDAVSFTGSTRAGRRVAALAAGTVKRVALELGGKSANVVLDDADLARAVKIGVANAFMNNGQACSAWTRLLVPADRHDEAVELAVAAAAKYEPGDPALPATRLGPAVSAAQRERVVGHIRSGIEQGARLALGGVERPTERGFHVAPTVFGGVTPEMSIAQEEIFGPVLSVMPYADEDDAVRIANSTIYGLGGAVFSADEDRALAVARRLRTGQVDINGAAFNTSAPFGGYRQSGNGREFGRFGLDEFTEVKSIQR
ncbi:aldehyde dehydrogenase (NAD+) [Saccharothrix coeruleofusca]|uniref:aldehyde dehydrogenase family protein n=1 Tax=Saccharothrix coeruleofusca TaxID=33919 RepID=UPI0027DDB6B6|nr:aldehyde dehydrogenase family protein [Saccharothrix coeruleofusca]MBP2334151.1 aldehyde dehydrogenase (NAD+) [Saccharothrix coeruleofusca]